jgi:Domain of unknown function (DUF1905)/Bacteriocin-protection, YdeI or OmpD-Associated
MKSKVVADLEAIIEKFPGKGGWCFVKLPGVKCNKNNKFGTIRVKGSIDGFELKAYNLMPFGNGLLFLPIKAEIRKKIGKGEGDKVKVKLFEDHDPLLIPDELLLCLRDEPWAFELFTKKPSAEQKRIVDWIFGAKQLSTRANRIVNFIQALKKGKRF